MSDTDLMTTAEVANRLKVTAETVRDWWKEGRIPGHRYSHKVLRFHLGEVVAALEAARRAARRAPPTRRAAHPEPADAAVGADGKPPPRTRTAGGRRGPQKNLDGAAATPRRPAVVARPSQGTDQIPAKIYSKPLQWTLCVSVTCLFKRSYVADVLSTKTTVILGTASTMKQTDLLDQ